MNKNNGFTLMELLVVIAIISLLASIVFASVSAAREKTNVIKAEVQAVEIEKAVELSRLSSGILPFSNTDKLVSIKESPEIVNVLKDYHASIENLSLPEMEAFPDKDYYFFYDTSSNSSVVTDGGVEYPTTCQKDFLSMPGMALDDWENDWGAANSLYTAFTYNWKADNFSIAYLDYYNPNAWLCSEWGAAPGFDFREEIKDRNILYINKSDSEYDWAPVSGCKANWVCS